MPATPSNISSNGGEPKVTVTGTNLVRYTCRFSLWKPIGQTWPETGRQDKEIHAVTFNMNHAPTDTFSLGPAASLKDLGLTWDIDMIVPGGGGPLQYSVSVEIKQDGNTAMNPSWTEQGPITNVEVTSGETELRVTP
ncbi:MAG TPA: hypothetical protein VGJ55_16260 [Pyrinomonadaceae bacterium]